jgi:hypothetical protein
MKKTILVALTIAAASFAMSERSARAADTKSRVVEIPITVIYGHGQVPVASVEVTKIAPKVTLSELRQPFANRIAGATKHDPF